MSDIIPPSIPPKQRESDMHSGKLSPLFKEAADRIIGYLGMEVHRDEIERILFDVNAEIDRLRKIIEMTAKDHQRIAVSSTRYVQILYGARGYRWHVVRYEGIHAREVSRHADLWDAIRAAEEAGT